MKGPLLAKGGGSFSLSSGAAPSDLSLSLSKVQPVFAESHAAGIKHNVIRVERTMGAVKANLQHKAVIATKQMASAHAMLRTRAKVSAGSPASSHANTAENKRNTEKKNPNALKKSQ